MLSSQALAQTWQFDGLGFIGGGGINPSSYAAAVSADGAIVVGASTNASDQYEAFRWAGGTMQRLGFIDGGGANPFSHATAVSADGTVVVGASRNAINQSEAFRWAGGTMQGLGFIDGGGADPSSEAHTVSANGAVVVGQSSNASDRTEAFRWAGGTMQGLGFIDGGGIYTSSYAYAVSADGAVVVGQSTNASNQYEAFRWAGDTMQGLGFIGGGGANPFGYATAVSADGAVVVGRSSNASDQHEAFRWADDTMQGLGFIDGGGTSPSSLAIAVSADGAVVVGRSSNASDRTEAFRWAAMTGMQSVQGLLATNGVSIGTWHLTEPTAISADGSVIVGYGIDPSGSLQAWLVRYVAPEPPVPPGPPPGFLSMAELAASIHDMNKVVTQAQGSVISSLDDQKFIAFNQCSPTRSDRPFCAYVTGTGNFWTGGDWGGHGTAGLAAQVVPGLSIGVNANLGTDRFDLRLGGRNDVDAYGGSVYATFAPSTTGLRLLGAVSANHLDLDVTRATMNGVNSVVTSKGSRNGHSLGALASVGWTFAVTDHLRATPFADLQWSRVRLGHYEEDGGPFPIAWAGQNLTETVSRVGAELRWAVTPELELNGSAAWAHRVSGTTGMLHGRLIGLSEISGAKRTLPDNWADASIGATWQMAGNLRIGTAIGTRIGPGSRPNVSTRVGLSGDF